MKWHCITGYPKPEKIATCDTIEEAIEQFETNPQLRRNEWNSAIFSDSFGCGGSHCAVFRNGMWVNRRTGEDAKLAFGRR